MFGINWRLLEEFDLRDLHPLREPAVWAGLIGSLVKVVSDAVASGADGWTVAVVVVNFLLAFIVRGQVIAPKPPKR